MIFRREPFGNRRLADAGIADEQWVVLLASAEHLDGAQHLALTSNQRIYAAIAGLLVEIDAIRVERVGVLLLFASDALAIAVALFIDAAHRPRLRHAGSLGNPMTDILHGIEARHVLLLQEKRGVAFTLGENRDQDVGTGNLFTPRRLNVDDGAMHDALKAGGRAASVCPLMTSPSSSWSR